MVLFARVRCTIGAAAVAAMLAACSGNSTPLAPVTAGGTSASSSSIAAQREVKSPLGRVPYTLADLHGALVPYFKELRAAGLLSSAVPKSWLDRPAFDKVFDQRRTDVTGSGQRPAYVVYAASSKNTIDIYQSNTYEPQQPDPPMIGQIADNGTVSGLAVDRNQNLYVNGNDGQILEYSRASMPTVTRQISDSYEPQGIAVGPDGTVYAADFDQDASGKGGVSVIPPGASSPTKTLGDVSVQHAYYITVDIKGNVYFTYFDNSAGLSLGEFKAGSTTLTKIPLTDSPYDVELDANGDLLIANPGTASIDTIPNGSTTASSSFPVASQGQYFLFDQTYARNEVFADAYGTNNAGGPLLQFTYPQGIQIDTIDHGTYAFALITAPAAPLASPYNVPVAGASPSPAPVQTISPNSCQNGSIGPNIDVTKDQVTFGGGTTCVGPNSTSMQISTTATLFDANDNTAVRYFSFGVTGPNDGQSETTVCPGYGSYYVVVTSNVAPAVKSPTVTKAGC